MGLPPVLFVCYLVCWSLERHYLSWESFFSFPRSCVGMHRFNSQPTKLLFNTSDKNETVEIRWFFVATLLMSDFGMRYHAGAWERGRFGAFCNAPAYE